jgi:predicted nucleic acid-binding Zn ribbon protein
MKTCPRCAEQVQDGAKVCRHCGHSFVYQPREMSGCGMLMMIVTGLVVVAWLFSSGPSEREQNIVDTAVKTNRAERYFDGAERKIERQKRWAD